MGDELVRGIFSAKRAGNLVYAESRQEAPPLYLLLEVCPAKQAILRRGERGANPHHHHRATEEEAIGPLIVLRNGDDSTV